MARGIFAGSFDPFTVGHMYIVEVASRLFDNLFYAKMLKIIDKWSIATYNCIKLFNNFFVIINERRDKNEKSSCNNRMQQRRW